MFVAASKLLDVLLSPLAWAALLLVAALLARGRAALRAALVATALARAVESGAPRTFREDAVYDVAIVLSGAVRMASSRWSDELELGDAADRVVRAWDLLHAGRARHVLLTGQSGRGSAGPREVELVAARLRSWGVPPARLVLEGASRNTRENALESARVVRERGWRSVLLVTSAAHMPRALGCFRAVGLAPDALPVDHRGGEVRVSLDGFLPRAHALATSTDALREWAGRLVCRALGYSR